MLLLVLLLMLLLLLVLQYLYVVPSRNLTIVSLGASWGYQKMIPAVSS